MQQRSRFCKKRLNRHSTYARVPAPSKIKNIIDKVASTFRRPANLFDMEGRLGSRRKMRLEHFGIAHDGCNDVVEVMGDTTGQGSDHLHAARAFQPLR